MKEYCTLDLRAEMPSVKDGVRFLLKEGHMKMVEKQGKKDVYVFLFTDCLIVTKAKKNSDKYRILKQPYRLNKTVFHALKENDQVLFVYLDEFGVAVSACILQTDAGDHEKWKTCLREAKEAYETMLRDEATCNMTEDEEKQIFDGSEVEAELFRSMTSDEVANPSDETDSVSQIDGTPTNSTEQFTHTVTQTATELANSLCDYEWDNTLVGVTAVLFIILNIGIYRIYKFIF